MSATSESFVKVAKDSDGKLVRTLDVQTSQGETHQQVVTLADEFGRFDRSYESQRDIFGRLRVALLESIFDNKQLFDGQPRYWDTKVTGGGLVTYDGTNVQSVLSVTGGSDRAIRQTFMRFNYQPGKSQLITFTGRMDKTETATRKRAGYYDDVDGVFFETAGGVASWNIMKNGAITETAPQSAWNIDKLDGSGPSGLVVDLTKAQLFVINYAWLGVGPVRVGFQMGNGVIYVHSFLHMNEITSAFMATSNLPIRQDILSTGGAGSMSAICVAVLIEGRADEAGTDTQLDTGVSAVTLTAGTIVPMIAIRYKAGREDTNIRAVKTSIIAATQNDNLRWSLRINPTIGGSLSWADVPNTPYQVAFGTTSNAVTSGTGDKVGGGYVSSLTKSDIDIPSSYRRIGTSIDGVSDVLALCVEGLTSTTGFASLVMREF